jgi:hypothetical protein
MEKLKKKTAPDADTKQEEVVEPQSEGTTSEEQENKE